MSAEKGTGESLVNLSPGEERRYGVHLKTGVSIVEIDRDRKCVVDSEGEALPHMTY